MEFMNLLYLLLFLSVPLYREPIKSVTPSIETDLVWVYFTDKGFTTTDEYNQALKVFSPKLSPDAVARRVRHNQTPADFNDLPVYQRYLDEIQALGSNLRTVSNWLNAASFKINQALIPKINSLPYVYDIKPVVVSKTEIPQTTFKINKPKSVKKSNLRPDKIEPAKNQDTTEYRRHYGPSLEQNAMLGVPQLFFQGYTGSKVKVGFLDTGLKKNNRALSHLDTTVVLEHDFLAGDDFFQSTGPDFLTSDVISNLKDIPRVKEPILSYSEPATDTNFIFYTADNFYGFDTFPRRALYYAYTTDAGNTWSQPITITPATIGLGCRTPSAVAGSGQTYVVWQSSPAPNEEVGNIYFGFFKNIVWQGEVLLNQGKFPDIYLRSDTLYLVFVASDTLINFQRGIIFNDSIHWEARILVDHFSENIISPQILLDSLNEIEIFATGLKSGKIYHFRSVDNIYSFELRPNPVNTDASAFQAYIMGNTIHLIYKNYSQSPFVKISYLTSNNGGDIWNPPISVTDDLLTIGAFSFMADDKFYVSYESYGSIYLAQSTDGLNWTNSSVDTSEFLFCPMFTKTTNNRSLVWLRRGDDNTDYEPAEDNVVQADHGTHMVSIIAGYKTGEIVGVAPSVDILIAKTEFHRTKSGNQGRGYAYEYTVEEDAWIEGLEWAERHGAQIISSSLGYRSWYGEAGLDGKTAPISIAAGLGADRGLIIVTAMGNRGQDSLSYPWPSPYIVAPGDASGVITAGGVHKYRTPWRGSGAGPTIDGRMKPELVAMSDTVVVVMPDSADGIEGSAGTSDATALIAGCCALILEAHPDWNADSVKQALFSTAVIPPGYDTINESEPMYVFGYGIPNVDSALKLYPPETPSYESDQLLPPYPNPFILSSDNDMIYFPFSLTRPTKVADIKIFTLSGELVYDTALADVPRPGRYGINGNRDELIQIGASWSGKNNDGKKVGSGLYFIVFKTGYATDIKKFAVVR
jgi:hypothetical protein